MEIRAPLAAPRPPAHTWGLWPPALAARQPGRRLVAGLLTQEMIVKFKETINYFVLQIIKSIKCYWHSFKNIRFRVKT